MLEPRKDTQSMSQDCTKVQQCPGPSTGDSHCQGPPPSSKGLAGPRDKREGGRARTWLRRSPSLPWLCFAAVPGPGRRPRLTFLCLPGLPGPIKPKYSHSPGGHMRTGGRRRGCSHHAPQTPGGGRHGAPPLSSQGAGAEGGQQALNCSPP